MPFQIAGTPIKRIRSTAYDAGELTDTEPITEQELGFWIRANSRRSIPEFGSVAEFLCERVACPRQTSRTQRIPSMDRKCLEEALKNLQDHLQQGILEATQLGQASDSDVDDSVVHGKESVSTFYGKMKKWIPVGQFARSKDAWNDLKAKVDSFSELADGWNSYSAPRPARIAIRNVREFLDVLFAANMKPNRIRPSAVGGIGVTFRRGEKKSYVEFLNSGSTYALFSDGVEEPQVREISGEYRDYLRLTGEIRKYLNA